MSSISSALALEECELSQSESAAKSEGDLLQFAELALAEKPNYFSLSTPKTNVFNVTGKITVSF